MKYLRLWQAGLLLAVFVAWHLLTTPGLLPNFMFENDRQAAFFFGEPLKIFGRIGAWFFTNADIYQHLGITLLETVLADGPYALGEFTIADCAIAPALHRTIGSGLDLAAAAVDLRG